MIDGDEVVELVPALAGRDPSGGYLFYDCQTDDVRLVLTVLAEAERFGAVPVNRVEAVALTDERRARARRRRRRRVRGARGERRQRDRRVGRPAAARRAARRGRGAGDPARAAGTHIVLPSERLPVAAGAIAPAGGGRTIFVLPWLGQTLVGTTDNDYDGDIEHVRPADEDVDLPARRGQRVLRHRARAAATSPARTPACAR